MRSRSEILAVISTISRALGLLGPLIDGPTILMTDVSAQISTRTVSTRHGTLWTLGAFELDAGLSIITSRSLHAAVCRLVIMSRYRSESVTSLKCAIRLCKVYAKASEIKRSSAAEVHSQILKNNAGLIRFLWRGVHFQLTLGRHDNRQSWCLS